MADIELVIKIPEEIYIHFLSRYKYQGTNDIGLNESGKVGVAIKNGTPLPKGHGELKDADVMINKLCTCEASEFFGSVTCAEIMDFIDSEKPIIEADKESER